MIAVDTSVIVSLWVPNDMEKYAYGVLRKDPQWVAPQLWRSEMRNVLALYLRKKILDFPTVLHAIQEAEHLMEPGSFVVNTVQVMHFVNKSDCSSYDCEFVALAHELGIQLVTFNKKLHRQFPEIALSPQEFLE